MMPPLDEILNLSALHAMANVSNHAHPSHAAVVDLNMAAFGAMFVFGGNAERFTFVSACHHETMTETTMKRQALHKCCETNG